MADYRILVVDDNRAIHEDFRKILASQPDESGELDQLAADLFGDDPSLSGPPALHRFEVSSAYQGRQGFEMVQQSVENQAPFALAFVDMRMPPGWDGLETIQAIWEVESEVHTVICTAHSDHSWADIVDQLGSNDRLLVIKKPFDAVEVVQCAHALCEKWRLHRLDKERLGQLERLVQERTLHLKKANAQLEKEMRERQRIEVELRHAQKLEAVGQLAAGVAHEINTPIQYVGDSLTFLRESFGDSASLLGFYRELLDSWKTGGAYESFETERRKRESEADIEYILENTPAAFERCLEGVSRVARIVRAMKEFAHPGSLEVGPANLNHALSTTLDVARNEYKLVADVQLQLGDLPDVTCSIGDINQVFLNLIVNAAHAIEPTVSSKGRGTIAIRTWVEDGYAHIAIKDTGTGIPETIRHQIFDPFFTTKAVGKGTGQGLALAHAVIVDRHGGAILVESEEGRGTEFQVRLPIDGDPSSVRKTA